MFNPNRSLDPGHISLDCWADGWLWVRRRSGLRRELTSNKMPTRKWKMAGSYLLYNELHYNGPMTYLGLTLRSIFFYFIKWLFTANDGLFYEKRRLVLWKTTACFMRNDVSFCEKQRVVLRETTCRFVGNNGSFFRTQWRGNERHGKVQIEKREMELWKDL